MCVRGGRDSVAPVFLKNWDMISSGKLGHDK